MRIIDAEFRPISFHELEAERSAARFRRSMLVNDQIVLGITVLFCLTGAVVAWVHGEAVISALSAINAVINGAILTRTFV